MTPRMLRTFAYAAFAIVVAIGVIWLLQEMGVVTLIDDPIVGIIGFGLIGFLLAALAKRGSRPPA